MEDGGEGNGGEGKMRYNGGSRKCVLVREGMGVKD